LQVGLKAGGESKSDQELPIYDKKEKSFSTVTFETSAVSRVGEQEGIAEEEGNLGLKSDADT